MAKCATCGDILQAVRNAKYVLVPVENSLLDMQVRVDKKDLEKQLLFMSQGDLKQPSGFLARWTKVPGRKGHVVSLRQANF